MIPDAVTCTVEVFSTPNESVSFETQWCDITEGRRSDLIEAEVVAPEEDITQITHNHISEVRADIERTDTGYTEQYTLQPHPHCDRVECNYGMDVAVDEALRITFTFVGELQ